MVGRFAPSPTGRMHLGNIWSALWNWLAIRKENGTLLLRIEDIDRSRCRPEHTGRLLADLKLLGLDWDALPSAYPPPEEPMRQQLRLPLYQEILNTLKQQGLVYPCFCSRADLHAGSAPHAEDGHVPYGGTCRLAEGHPARYTARNTGKPPAWRLRVPSGQAGDDAFTDRLQGLQRMNLSAEWGDFILVRADGQFAYQFVCAVDDALTGVDFVLRGADLLRSAFPQRYLFRLLGKTAPGYCHIPLLVDSTQARLSKRQKSLDLGELLVAGQTPQAVIGRLACLAGWIDRPEPATPRELLPFFSLASLQGARTLTVPPEMFHDVAFPRMCTSPSTKTGS